MAVIGTNGFTYGIRKGLTDKGIADSDIGYNQGSGWVTVGGDNFIKADKNYNGTTFTNEQNFNNAWNDYQKRIQQQQKMVSAPTPTTPAPTNPTPTYNPYETRNPYDSQLNDLISSLMRQAQNPAPVDLNQIYGSPQYAAYQAQAQRSAQQGVRAAQESMGASGFGRSTALAERAQGIQNDANEYLNTQVIPQLMAQAQAEKQQQLQNQMMMLGQLSQQQGVYDNRFNTANNLAIDQAQLTGNYTNPEAQRMIDQIIQLGESWKTGTPEQQAQYHQEANRLRAQLQGMGIDPSLFGADKTTEERLANVGKAGVRTIQGQNLDQNKAQQEWENMFRQAQFDEAIAARIWEQAFKEKSFQQDVKEAAASRGLQWASLNQRQKEFIADQAFREKQFKLEQDKFDWSTSADNPDNAPKSRTPSKNELESEYYTRLDTFTPEQLKTFFKQEKQNIINDLGKSGYDDLKEEYGIK